MPTQKGSDLDLASDSPQDVGVGRRGAAVRHPDKSARVFGRRAALAESAPRPGREAVVRSEQANGLLQPRDEVGAAAAKRRQSEKLSLIKKCVEQRPCAGTMMLRVQQLNWHFNTRFLWTRRRFKWVAFRASSVSEPKVGFSVCVRLSLYVAI